MADPAAVHLTFEDKDVAVLTLDDPRGSANVLSRSLLEELEKHLDALQLRGDLAGLVIRSGKPGVFIVGADIREFLANIDAPKEAIVEMCARGRKLFERLSKMPFVTVTAYHGQCVGGGAELALWCDRRVVSSDSKAMFGFPEVKLGLLPGWGGTVRAPRVLGLANAIELVTSGESIDAKSGRPDGPGFRRRPRRQTVALGHRRRPRRASARAIGSAIARPGRSRSTSATLSSASWARRLRP